MSKTIDTGASSWLFYFWVFYFFSLHVSGAYVPIIRSNNCICATLVTCYSAWMTVWYAGAYTPPYQTVNYFHIYTVQELRYKSRIANYLHPCLLFLDIQFQNIFTHIKMLKFQKTPTCFGPLKDHPQGVRQTLLKLPLCTINMYAYVGDVGKSIRY